MIVRKSGTFLIVALLAGSFSTARADLAAGLVGHWMMDDGMGVAATDSVGGNDGVLQGDATWTTGHAGGAVLLDGQGDYINCGNKPAFNVTDAITLAAWIQPDGDFAYPDWSGIIMRGGPNIDTYALYFNKGGLQLGFKTTGTTPNWFASPAGSVPAMFDGEWHHAAATYDGATKVIYFDGDPLANLAATGKIETSTGQLLIGAGRDLTPVTHFAAGRIDEVRIYSRALTAADIKQFFPPKLQAYTPDPADGETGVTIPMFSWTAGDTAAFHEMYIGTAPDPNAMTLVQPRSNVAMAWYFGVLEPGRTYYWRVDEIEQDETTVHAGDTWSFIVQDVKAYHPTPADGAGDVSTTPALTWLPGDLALRHHVYFSDSNEAVAQGATDADKGVLTDANFAPDALEPATTYFWRVDELKAGDEIVAGPVWSFTTHLVIEDFESYTDDQGSRIYQTWIDGYTNDLSGSTVGHVEAPFAEQTIVLGGKQSMPLDYNNLESPFYSETEREFDPAADWTVNDLDTLVLNIRGRLSNSPEPLYVAVEDSSGNIGTVVHPDPAVVARTKWAEWRIPFGEFTAAGVNMSQVRKLYLGLGDRNDPQPGTTGMIYLDNIRAIKTAE